MVLIFSRMKLATVAFGNDVTLSAATALARVPPAIKEVGLGPGLRPPRRQLQVTNCAVLRWNSTLELRPGHCYRYWERCHKFQVQHWAPAVWLVGGPAPFLDGAAPFSE